MASNGANLRVRISADLADIKQGLAVLRGDLNSLKKQASTGPSMQGWTDSLGRLRTQLLSIGTAYAALRSVKWYTQQADAANNMAARLKLATKSQDEFTRAYKGTYAIAQSTSSDWESVVDLYSNVAKTTGLGQDQLLSMAKTIGQTFQISGAGAVETSQGMRQLMQALASGRVQAEEFNSILDSNPRLVQAVADHFGIAFGQVRKYVNDGKVSSQDLMNALLEAGQKVQGEFDQLPNTVGRAMQQVRNAMLAMVGDADDASGASRGLANSITDLARTLESPEVKQGFATFVSGVVVATNKLATFMATSANKVKDMAESVAAHFNGPAFGDIPRIKDYIAKLQKQRDALAKSQPAMAKGLDAEIEKYKLLLEMSRDAAAATAAAGMTSGKTSTTTTTSTGRGAGAGTGAGTAKAKAIAASTKLEQDAVSRALTELKRLYDQSELSTSAYYTGRQKLEEQAIDLQIQQARNELAITTDLGKRRDLEEQIATLQRDRGDVGTRAAREQQAAEEDLAKQLGDVKLQLMELDGDTAGVARANLETQFRDLLKRLEADSDETGKKMVYNLIDRLVDKAKADELGNAISRVTGSLSSQEGSISAQMQAGGLGYLEGERRLYALRQQSITQLQALREKQAAYLATLGAESPEYAAAVQALAGLDTNIANIAASMDTLGQSIADGGLQSLQTFFTNLREGSMSAMESLRTLVSDFAASIYDALAQNLSQAIMGQLQGFISQGTGWLSQLQLGGTGGAAMATQAATAAATIQTGATTASTTLSAAGTTVAQAMIAGAQTSAAILRAASIASSSVGAAHGGGTAGAWHMFRHVNIPPIAFAAAPRYHSGGVAGLRPNEVPAILERGERIRTEEQEAALQDRLRRNTAGTSTVTTPIVAIGDDAVANALAGAAGEKIVITHVRNNWGGLSRGS